MDAAEDLDEGRFAGAVFAQQGMHFARQNLEVDAAQRPHAAKALGDALDTDQGAGDDVPAIGFGSLWRRAYASLSRSPEGSL